MKNKIFILVFVLAMLICSLGYAGTDKYSPNEQAINHLFESASVVNESEFNRVFGYNTNFYGKDPSGKVLTAGIVQ